MNGFVVIDTAAMNGVNGPAAVAAGSARFVGFSNDAEIECTRLNQLAKVVNFWFCGCINLTALDCTGLTHLSMVGQSWLCDCTSLTALNCTGLTQLTSVGSFWLFGCTGLTALDCTGGWANIGCATAPV